MWFQRLKAPFSRSTSATPTEVLLLSLASIDSLKLNPNKAFQPILHFFGRMSAQPPVIFSSHLTTAISGTTTGFEV
ncbi:MAG: hypothetical protein DCF22_09845 [Leptolyngbya sp.]|nr:MAG: hypothetical protein DCF22_09845 [Leptolyngbya sp.]